MLKCNERRNNGMPCKYPIVLVHGIAAKQLKILNAFGKIGDKLKESGERVFVARTDGFGRISTNAEQLKRYVLEVKKLTGAERVNIIAHSKGGLDTRFMITELDMEDSVASLTTLCTPHKGSVIASKIWLLPKPIKKFIAFFIDGFYKVLLKDETPDSMGACEELRLKDESEDTLCFSHKVYCQSYSSTLQKGRDCFIMGLPMKIYKHYENIENDGLVSSDSAKFANYRGECLDISVSHVQIIDLFAKKSQKEKIYAFYKQVASELSDMDF